MPTGNTPLVSRLGTQRVAVIPGNGVTTIQVTDVRKGRHTSVTVFDELLPGILARLTQIALSKKNDHPEVDHEVPSV